MSKLVNAQHTRNTILYDSGEPRKLSRNAFNFPFIRPKNLSQLTRTNPTDALNVFFSSFTSLESVFDILIGKMAFIMSWIPMYPLSATTAQSGWQTGGDAFGDLPLGPPV